MSKMRRRIVKQHKVGKNVSGSQYLCYLCGCKYTPEKKRYSYDAEFRQKQKAGERSMNSRWEFGERQIMYSAMGVLCHSILSWIIFTFNLPMLGYINLVIPIFFGVAFGPWVGLIVGGVGALGGTLGHGDVWNLPTFSQSTGGLMSFIPAPLMWMVGDGLTGLISGLFSLRVRQYNRWRDIATAIYAGILGVIVGILCVWLFYLSNIEWNLIIVLPASIMKEPGLTILGIALIVESFFIEQGPEFLRELIAVIVLLPILMLSYHAIVSRRSSSNTT